MADPIDQFLDDSEHDDDEELEIHPPMVVDRKELAEPHHESVVENAKEDYEFVRTNLKQIIETNVKGLEGLAKVAQQSESPRAYEVLSTFMKQMADANESLMKLHKDVKDITNETGGGSGDDGDSNKGGNTYNFHGSTEEFLEHLERLDKQGDVIDVTPEVAPDGE